MKTTSIKIKSYVNTVDVMVDSDLQYKIFHIMLLSFGVLALCYVLILGNMVFNIVERKVMEKEALALSNEVGALELSYLSISNKVDLSLSYSLGFKEVKPTYAVRKSFGLNFPLNTSSDNEI